MSLVGRRSALAALLGISLVGSGAVSSVHAEQPPSGRRLALGGYDPVAYFTLGRPEKGDAAFWFAFDDAVYYFKTAEHRATFAADPEKYAPQFAGFCAAAISKGIKVEPDPEAWAIIGGKLYVVALKERLAEFKRNADSVIGKANAVWPVVREEPVQGAAR